MRNSEPMITSWKPCFELLEPRVLLDGGPALSSLMSLASPIAPVVLQDTEGQAAVHVDGATEATIEPWAGGQQLRVRQDADSYTDPVMGEMYEEVLVDVMLSGPGGAGW